MLVLLVTLNLKPIFYKLIFTLIVWQTVRVKYTYLYTLPAESLSALTSVYSKTTLNPGGGVGVAGADPQICKSGTFFLMSLCDYV